MDESPVLWIDRGARIGLPIAVGMDQRPAFLGLFERASLFLKCDAGVVSAISMIERFHALTMALHTASRRSKTTWKQHKAMIK
jgi:hypothetical protein